MFANFYQGRNVLVTGAAGVKGSWLCLQLVEAGAGVTGVDRVDPPHDSVYRAAGVGNLVRFVRGDVTDADLMTSLAEENECLFHLAAVVLVGDALRNPLDTYRSNVLGTATVLEAVRRSPSLTHAVFVTTDKVYRDKGGQPWTEGDRLFATGPYPVSKACAEEVIADYHRTYFARGPKRVAVARAGNVLIGGDFHASSTTGGSGRLFVDCAEALMGERPPELYRPEQVRPYTYGLDILSGYLALMAALDGDGVAGEAFNFGPHEHFGIQNRYLATKMCELWGGETGWRPGPPRDEPFEKQALAWDKARAVLGWEPVLTFHEALRETVRWYKEWAAHGRSGGEGAMHAVSTSQIKRHWEGAVRLGLAWAR